MDVCKICWDSVSSWVQSTSIGGKKFMYVGKKLIVVIGKKFNVHFGWLEGNSESSPSLYPWLSWLLWAPWDGWEQNRDWDYRWAKELSSALLNFGLFNIIFEDIYRSYDSNISYTRLGIYNIFYISVVWGN